MDLLVAGASGFLGRNVILATSPLGWNVVGMYHKSRTFPAFASQNGCVAVRVDLSKLDRAFDADVCVYVAGSSDHRSASTSPYSDLISNTAGLVRFLEHFSGALVLVSSAAVYAGHSGLVSPRTPLDPGTPYAISKFASELYARYSEASHRTSWVTVLRLYYGYGPHDRPTRLVPRIARAVLHRDKTFRITAPPGSLVDPLYAEDVARAVLAAARGRAKGLTLDLCSGAPMDVPTLVRTGFRALDWQPELVEVASKEEIPSRFHSRSQGWKSRLGFGTLTPFEEGVRRYFDWLEGSARRHPQ